MTFCFRNILQIWIILIGFQDTNDFVNLLICKHELGFTCRGYWRFTRMKFALHADRFVKHNIECEIEFEKGLIESVKDIISKRIRGTKSKYIAALRKVFFLSMSQLFCQIKLPASLAAKVQNPGGGGH